MSNLETLIQNLPEDIDAGLIYSSVNRFYFTDFSATDGLLVVTHRKAYFLIDFRYYEQAYSSIKNADVILLKNELKQLNEIFIRHNCKNVSVENEHISLDKYLHLKENFKNINFLLDKRFNCFINNLRIIKTQEEISKISASQAISELAFEHILGFIAEGKTEKEIALELNNFILQRADDLAFETIVVSGFNTSSPHGRPSDKTVQEGDFITMDFGARLNGYNSDMTRTVCIGVPTDEQLVVYKNVLFVQNMAIDYIKAGQKASEPDKLVREYFESQGFHNAFGHSLGHGVGLEIHESPILSDSSESILKENMVVTIEPGLYFPGKFGVRIEDIIVVLKDGAKNLTTASKELITL